MDCTNAFTSWFNKVTASNRTVNYYSFSKLNFNDICGDFELSKPVLKVDINYGHKVLSMTFNNGFIRFNRYHGISTNEWNVKLDTIS